MHVRYQGEDAATSAQTLAELLAEKSVDVSKAIVECDGEVYAPGSDLSAVSIRDGIIVDVFRIAAGG